MPLSQKPLVLEPDPKAVRDARAWIAKLLTALGRDDLVDSAQLGVSELVTNAVLHAVPPITVSLRGTRSHPRIEVHDGSDRPPEIQGRMTDEDFLLSTFGRGLGIVAWYSAAWGADLSGEGKTVWFEPVAEPHPGEDVPGDVFDLAEAVEHRLADAEQPDELVHVRLLNLPVRVFADFRRRYEELTRELRLLALAHGTDYPVSHEFAQLAIEVEQERRQALGTDGLDKAIAAGLDRVDLDYWVPRSAPATMGRLLELLEKANEFCRQERMLAVAATPQQLELQRWYLNEFVRQGAGEAPRAWTGDLAVATA
jgi:anti-sigma regulatory factor (Ser/Thr protein kinase)